MSPFSRMLPKKRAVLLLALISTSHAVHAAEYSLGIQPILSPQDTLSSFQPLADYLSTATGHTIKIKTTLDFYSYWKRSQRGDFDLILDAAHFTGYRAKYLNHFILAKVEDTVTYTLVTGAETFIFDPDELIGKPVASIDPPSLGAIRLQNMFPNPMREPLVKTVSNSKEAINQVLAGKVVAAMVPTPLIGQYQGLNTVLTTDPAPHIALSATPQVSTNMRQKIRKALLGAGNHPSGQAMLKAANLAGFEVPDEASYQSLAVLLEAGHSKLHRSIRIPNPKDINMMVLTEPATKK